MSKMNRIDVDDEVFEYLQKNARAFVDTPNDVLRRLLLDTKDVSQAQREATQMNHDSSNVDAFVIALLGQEFQPEAARKGRYRLMFETKDAVIYVQNFNKISSHLWYRVTEKPWKELRQMDKRAFICFTNPPEGFAYVIPVEDIERQILTCAYDRNFLEVNIDPVHSRWVELEWNIAKYRTKVPKAAA